MKYGNCLLGALVLLWRERKNNPKFIMKYRMGTRVPHFMVQTSEQLHHYKVNKDILPWPLCYVVFRGEFQTINSSETENFTKHEKN
jgi:hypothetical protein